MTSQNILITGANGFVGRALCTELARQGYTICGVVRDLSSTTGLQCELMEIHTIENADWSSKFANIDVIVHLAARVHVMREVVSNSLELFRAINVDATLKIAREAANAGVKRFVYLSSIKVNGESTSKNKPFTEIDIPNPHDAYAISKHEAEQGLLLIAKQTGMKVVIIRPPLVYGPGVKANFASLGNILKHSLPLPLGAIDNKRSFIYIGNLVNFIVKCVEHPAAANQLFLVSDGQDLSITDLLKACGKALNKKVWLLPVPQLLIEKVATLLGKKNLAQRLCGNLQVDISKAQRLMDWAPPISVRDGLKATFENK